jgi:D-alanine-D-alanine ligase
LSRRPPRKLKILVLMHPDLMPPEDAERFTEKESYDWKTEYDVIGTLQGLGHEVKPLGVQFELLPIRVAVEEWRPDVVFNLLEEFHGAPEFDAHVAGYLELMKVPYTGCNPRGLMLARGKALSKKLVHFHRIRVPRFAAVPIGQKVKRPRSLAFPLIVKSLTEEASRGISQASVVDNDAKLDERVRFVHERVGTDAIVEEFVEGREIYVGLLGNRRVEVLPVWELLFKNMPEGSAAIATERVKHDLEYQEKRGIVQQRAEGLAPELERRIQRTSKRVYKVLELDGYARVDYRLAADGTLFFLEANPNPDISKTNEFASAADKDGMDYADLLTKIVNLGLQRARVE